jgi:hypothetical protein
MSCPNIAYGPCGGKHWPGSTCCPTGTTCVIFNTAYHECRPSQSIPFGALPASVQQPEPTLETTPIEPRPTDAITGTIAVTSTIIAAVTTDTSSAIDQLSPIKKHQ